MYLSLPLSLFFGYWLFSVHSPLELESLSLSGAGQFYFQTLFFFFLMGLQSRKTLTIAHAYSLCWSCPCFAFFPHPLLRSSKLTSWKAWPAVTQRWTRHRARVAVQVRGFVCVPVFDSSILSVLSAVLRKFAVQMCCCNVDNDCYAADWQAMCFTTYFESNYFLFLNKILEKHCPTIENLCKTPCHMNRKQFCVVCNIFFH